MRRDQLAEGQRAGVVRVQHVGIEGRRGVVDDHLLGHAVLLQEAGQVLGDLVELTREAPVEIFHGRCFQRMERVGEVALRRHEASQEGALQAQELQQVERLVEQVGRDLDQRLGNVVAEDLGAGVALGEPGVLGDGLTDLVLQRGRVHGHSS